MSEQSVDLRSTWAVLRRRALVLFLCAALGAGAGVGLLILLPPPFTSTSVVLLPAVTQSGSGRLGGYDAETQALIVTSSEVMSRATRQLTPSPSVAEATDRVRVATPSSAVLRITAAGPTGPRAEALASAVAKALVDYLEETRGSLRAAQRAELQDRLDTLLASLDTVTAQITRTNARITARGATTPAGLADAAALADLTAARASTVLDIEALRRQMAGDDGSETASPAGASVIQPASPGVQRGYATDVLLHVLGGAVLLAALGASVVIMTNKRDPKLRSRDEIADSVGIPVVGSLRARPPRTAGAWLDLLQTYDPDSADGWALRRLLRTLATEGEGIRGEDTPLVLVVVSIGGDAGGLAIGPQIAAFAASTGISTELVAAQEHRSATALWAACSHASRQEPSQLRLVVATSPRAADTVTGEAAELSVRVVVLDREDPDPDPSVVTGHATVLAVSSAAATRRNLADVVVALDRLGLDVGGLVVANADPLDRSTGRLAAADLSGPGPRPTWITSRTPAGTATTIATGVRRRERRRSRP